MASRRRGDEDHCTPRNLLLGSIPRRAPPRTRTRSAQDQDEVRLDLYNDKVAEKKNEWTKEEMVGLFLVAGDGGRDGGHQTDAGSGRAESQK